MLWLQVSRPLLVQTTVLVGDCIDQIVRLWRCLRVEHVAVHGTVRVPLCFVLAVVLELHFLFDHIVSEGKLIPHPELFNFLREQVLVLQFPAGNLSLGQMDLFRGSIIRLTKTLNASTRRYLGSLVPA